MGRRGPKVEIESASPEVPCATSATHAARLWRVLAEQFSDNDRADSGASEAAHVSWR
jgi:hypothetical protein